MMYFSELAHEMQRIQVHLELMQLTKMKFESS